MNKFRKNTITLLLLGVFTFSSMGFTITSLCCNEKDNDHFSEASESCCIEQKTPSCCEEENPIETHECNHGCDGACFSTQEYSKLEIDQIVSIKIEYVVILSSTEFILDNIESKSDRVLSRINLNKSPPNSYGRTLVYSLNKPKIPYLA